MPVDAKLLEILCCPVTKQPLNRLAASRLEVLNRHIENKDIVYVGGDKVDMPISEALITASQTIVYRVDDGIPIMLENKGIATSQLQDF